MRCQGRTPSKKRKRAAATYACTSTVEPRRMRQIPSPRLSFLMLGLFYALQIFPQVHHMHFKDSSCQFHFTYFKYSLILYRVDSLHARQRFFIFLLPFCPTWPPCRQHSSCEDLPSILETPFQCGPLGRGALCSTSRSSTAPKPTLSGRCS